MWKLIILFYITTGLAIILFTRAGDFYRESTSDINTRNYPAWKVIGFFSIVYPVTALFWPIILPELFAKKKTAWDELNENPLFQEQKSLFDLMNLMSEDGVDTDVIPDGLGEFGLVSSNPIPCKTVYGGITYLAHLRTLEGNEIIYERVGSTKSDVSPHPVDVYEISLPDGQKLETIYISPYHKINSGKAPSGFSLVTGRDTYNSQKKIKHRPSKKHNKPKKCPLCGSTEIARIQYGLPRYTDDLRKGIEEGKIRLGGCCVTGNDPEYKCTKCSNTAIF